MLALIFLGAWLIGSGISKSKLKIKSGTFVGYYIGSVLLFVLMVFVGLINYKYPADYIVANNIKVPLGRCIQGNRKAIPDTTERKRYCSCIAEKLANSQEYNTTYRKELEAGTLDKIINDSTVQASIANYISGCFTSLSNLQWTDEVEKSFRSSLMKELNTGDFPQNYNVEAYCDCIINEYKKYPLNTIMKQDFTESDLSVKTDSLCKEKSKRDILQSQLY
jgi:hypothetical protein